MTKRLIQDIIVSPKKSPPRNVKPSKVKEERIKETEDIFYDFSKEEEPRVSIYNYDVPRIKYKLAGTALLVAVLIIGGISILNKFSSVVVEIFPRLETAEVDAVFNAKLDPKNGELPLEVMVLNREETASVGTTGVKDIKTQASGKIIIYNVYSSQPQSLVAGTRFETSDGKIYRVNKAIVVNGAKIENGKIVASETETTVFADKPGEEYNIGLTDFIIPGFQDKEKREKIFARSKTEMVGGLIGQKKIITEDDIASLRKSLREKIIDYFLKTAINPKPDEFIFYGAAKKIIFPANNNGNGNKNEPKPGDVGDTFELNESGTFYGFLIKKEDLGNALADKYFSSEDSKQLEILNPENLEFEVKKYDPTQITFGIKGRAYFIREFDKNNLKNELIAKRKNPESVFGQYAFMEKVRIIFKPSWWRRVPMDFSRIRIETIINQ